MTWWTSRPATEAATLRDRFATITVTLTARETGPYGGVGEDVTFDPPEGPALARLQARDAARRHATRRRRAVDAIVCVLADVDTPTDAPPGVRPQAEAALALITRISEHRRVPDGDDDWPGDGG